MAINLKKESYNNNTDTDIVKTVYPEQDSEEINPGQNSSEENADENFYPRQLFPENYGVPEIYPQRKSSAEIYYPKQAFPENYGAEEIYPAQSVQSENTAVPYNNPDKNVSENPRRAANLYPAAPPQKKTEISNVLAAAIIVFVSVITIFASLNIISDEKSEPAPKSEPKAVNNYTYTVKEVTEPVPVHPAVTDSEEPDYDDYYYYDIFEYGADEVDEIIIDGAFSSIIVSENDDSSIFVETEQFCDFKYEVYVIDKILTVSINDDYIDDYTGTVDVTLPAIYEGSVTVNSNSKRENSIVSCSAGKDINITAESGTVYFQDLSGSSASVSIEKGRIWIKECEMNKCDLYVDDGEISIRNSSISEKCTANANGVINTYSSVFSSEFEACGQIELEKTAFDGRTSLTAFDGYINGKKIDFEDIYIKSRGSTVNISTNASSADYTAVVNSDGNSTVQYEPSEPSGQGSNTIKLNLADSEVEFKFGN